MSRDDPKPLRQPAPTPATFENEDEWRRAVASARISQEDEVDEVKDENTWVGTGSPYTTREHTAEVSYFEETETNIDWNGPSAPMGITPEDTLNFDAQPVHGEGHTDYNTEPGFGTDAGSLSALRDAMRGPAGARARAAPGPLALPPPRARTNPGLPLPAPTSRLPAPRRPTPRRGGASSTPRPGAGLLAIVGPVVAGAIVLVFLAMLGMRAFVGQRRIEVDAPMLPVVGGAVPKAWPAPPWDIPAPDAFAPQTFASTPFDPNVAPTRIVELTASGDHVAAAAWADRLARTTNRPSMFFHVGALLSGAGDADSAMYWLVRSAQVHGFPPEWLVVRDHRELSALWADPRWGEFARWAVDQNRFYATGNAGPATIVLPSSIEAAVAKDAARQVGGSKAARAARQAKDEGALLPVLIWLDGVGGNGSSVLTWGQKVADDLGVIVVGLGGPERIGPGGSWWTASARRNREHVDSALAAVSNARPDPTRRYLVGLGQGAQYAVELVLRDADFAAGALALSPTDDLPIERDKIGEGRRDRKQKVLLAAGALVPEVHTLLRMDMGRLQRANVTAEIAIDEVPWPWPDQAPVDLGERVATWLSSMIDPKPIPSPVATTDPSAEAANTATATPAAPK